MESVVTILVVQGANMAYHGKRQPEIYGTTTAAELDDILHKHAGSRGYTLEISIPISKAKRSNASIGPSMTASMDL